VIIFQIIDILSRFISLSTILVDHSASFLKTHFKKSSEYQIFFKFIRGLKNVSVSLYICFANENIYLNLPLTSSSFSLFNKLRSEVFLNLENSISSE